MRKLTIAILTSLLMMACASIDCPVNNLVETMYTLQKPDGTPDTLLKDTLWVWADRIDGTSILLINRLCGAKATQFKIPVSYAQTEDTIRLETLTPEGLSWEDTIWVKKDNRPHFEGVDCKASYFHTIQSVRSTQNLIDTVIINNTEVNYDASKAHFLLRLKDRR